MQQWRKFSPEAFSAEKSSNNAIPQFSAAPDSSSRRSDLLVMQLQATLSCGKKLKLDKNLINHLVNIYQQCNGFTAPPQATLSCGKNFEFTRPAAMQLQWQLANPAWL